jgi:hypothetical protein
MKEKNDQTALEWLVEQVNSDCLNSAFIRPDLIKKAKEMERQQVVKFGEYISSHYGSMFGFHIGERIIDSFYDEFLKSQE